MLLTFNVLISRVSEPRLLSHVTVLFVLAYFISFLDNKHINVSKVIGIKLLIQGTITQAFLPRSCTLGLLAKLTVKNTEILP